MREPRNVIEEIEWAHRRLERAKKLIVDGLIQQVHTEDGTSYVCQSQTHLQERYLVSRESCPCEDQFRFNGQKLCKHILARLILEDGIDLSEIGKNPAYWTKSQRKKQPEGRISPKALGPTTGHQIISKDGKGGQRC